MFGLLAVLDWSQAVGFFEHSDEVTVIRQPDFLDDAFDLCAADEMPSFSGTVKFECSFTTEKCKKLLAIDGADGSVRAVLNGRDLGYRICPPYVYDISDCVLDGENALEITMNDTLANALRDKLSQYDALAPLGFDGIRLIDFENDRD